MDATQTLGEPRILISRSALLHNAALIRRSLHDRVRICAMLKADAYGHGADLVADTLCNFSINPSDVRPAVDAVAVATIDEAAALPILEATVLVLRPVENLFIGRQREKIDEAVENQWVLTLASAAGADDLARVAMARGKRAPVQVMVDTGMTRDGVPLEQLDDLLRKIQSKASLRLAGICTHLASGEKPRDAYSDEQMVRFRRGTDAIASAMPGRFLRHAANSGGVFFAPESHLDMVRPGIAFYGIDPGGRPDIHRPLRPALKWTAPLISVQPVRKGTPVGYGQSWVAPRDTRIGLIPVGYADGYARCFGGRAVVMLGGRPAPVVGRVSMDSITVDLADVPAAVGDEVTLLDCDPLSPVSAYALARWAETIPYEILSRIGPRMPRVIAESRSEVAPARES